MLTAKVDLSTVPPTLTVVSDKRNVSVTVAAAGDTLECKGVWPVKVADASGKVWALKSDDGTTTVFTG